LFVSVVEEEALDNRGLECWRCEKESGLSKRVVSFLAMTVGIGTGAFEV